jgi:type III restriction enzyme
MTATRIAFSATNPSFPSRRGIAIGDQVNGNKSSAADHRLAFYTPDFFARDSDGNYFLIETKGRQDLDVPRKASAAVEWCKSASKSGKRWEYIFIPQAIMEGLTSNRLTDLARAPAASV